MRQSILRNHRTCSLGRSTYLPLAKPSQFTTSARRRIYQRCHSQQPNTDATTSVLDNERVIASLTSIGINGSIAVFFSNIANINLWKQFDWMDMEGFQLAGIAAGILIAYEFALLGVPWQSGMTKTQSESITNTAQSIPGVPSSALSTAQQQAINEDIRDKDSDTTLSNSLPKSPFNLQLSPQLLTDNGDQTMSFELLRATLAMQRACYVATATMMRRDVPPAVDAGLIVLRESSKELLQRGLLFTFLAGWIADRCFEAGADDVISIAGSDWYTTDACRAAVAALTVIALLPPALGDAQALSLSVATNWAVMSTHSGDEGQDDSLVQEYRLYDALQRTVYALPAKLTRVLHGTRGVIRAAAVCTVFAITQNLAASWAVAVSSNLLLLAYSVAGKQQLGLSTQPQGEKTQTKKQKQPPKLQWPQDDKKDDDK